MKIIAIIGIDTHPDGKETAAQIAESLRPWVDNSRYEVKFINFDDIVFDIAPQRVDVFDSRTGVALHDCSVVLLTNWFHNMTRHGEVAHTLALYLNARGITLMNGEALRNRSTSKLSQMMRAALEGVPIPRTLFCMNLEALQKYMQQQCFAEPFIFKKIIASRGQGNYLLSSIAEIANFETHHTKNNPFIVQQFIESDNSDYRLFMVGGKIRLVIHRMGQENSHLNNTSAGASTEIIPVEKVPAEAVHVAEAMSRILHREMTGLDVIFDRRTGAPYFLEANLIPQIATGSNVDRKLKALAEGLMEAADGIV